MMIPVRFDSAPAEGDAGRPSFGGDPHRPSFHFLPPANWINDPNGLIEWEGEVHLFYQYNPHSPRHERIHWGHAAGRDLLHWRDLPIALTPRADEHDGGGCWSGCAVNDGGTPTLLYTGVFPQVVNRAVSHDGLVTWRKDAENPVIDGPPEWVAPESGGNFRDPFVWREGGEWRMVIGTRVAAGGVILLYRSADLRAWELVGPYLAGDARSPERPWSGTMWECPNLLPFDERALLIISPQSTASDLLEPVWHSGPAGRERFESQRDGVLVYGHIFYAPQALRLADGRRLMWGWLKEGRALDAGVAVNWTGALSVPIEITLDAEGAPRLAPARELESLRRQHYHFEEIALEETPRLLEGVRADALDLEIELELEGDAEVDLLLRVSPNLAERTVITIGGAAREIRIDRAHAGGAAAHDWPALAPLLARGAVTLRLLLDRSTLELFADEGRTTVATRIYPENAASLHVGLCARGAGRVKRLDLWTMASVW